MSRTPTRPGPWLTAWKTLWESHKLPKQYVGEDQYGNKYYELPKPRSTGNVSRGYDPAPGAPDPPVEWLAWTKMTRRFPPSEEEIRLNKARQQQQLATDAETEKRAPQLASSTGGGSNKTAKEKFPEYKEDDFEHIPGAGKENKNLSDKDKCTYILMHESIKRIFDGILLFRKFKRPAMVKEFERVRDHPDPRAVLFTCMDSRLQPSEFMQARIGDLFVVRNSANMVPLARNFGGTASEVSVTTEPAALELAIKRGNVCQVLVCGHSDCKAINTLYQLYNGRAFDPESPMDHWLRHNGHLSIQKLEKLIKNEKSSKKLEFASENGLMKFKAKIDPENKYGVEDKLSQINTLQQLTNIVSHEFLREHIEKRLVGLQAFWLDIFTGELYFFSRRQESFVPIDEENAASLLKEALCSVDD